MKQKIPTIVKGVLIFAAIIVGVWTWESIYGVFAPDRAKKYVDDVIDTMAEDESFCHDVIENMLEVPDISDKFVEYVIYNENATYDELSWRMYESYFEEYGDYEVGYDSGYYDGENGKEFNSSFYDYKKEYWN